MSKVISFINSKGGTGKTTLTFSLALFLQSQGVKIAVVDIDPQQSISQLSGAIKMISIDQIGTTKDQIILIDSPPYLSDQVPRVVALSDFVVIPILPSMIDIVASKKIINEVISAGKKYALVLNRVKSGTSVTDELSALLRSQEYNLFSTQIFDRVSYQRAFAFQALELTGDKKMMNEIELFAGELFRNLSI